MLMDEINEQHGQEQTDKSDDAIITIGNDPVMLLAVDVLSVLGKKDQVILRAKGNSIPNAVAVANIITEKMLKGNSKVGKITVDTEAAAGIGSMTSTVEIILNKI
ncbi:DNA-binding protein [Marine Group I thaumarchaeote]|uniref:DNA-binding protein n=1 Tax=Marine Group I thaumarchaeote TaxID=2511932 RepID=A0A7K4MJM0_9ARCH|nr:DNA-binding protein [Candidatus Nitrosopumilus sp. MTA1]NWJ28772.1 DNA-binding protein [Marine Group I thaumarchaeote]NWJ57238.1 DNA-binding protein [Marine Group I thaumarchaeote]NWJ83717.1 DNA-binding protein [Marine Group I thaumarchaeote]NWK07635.1 DNA-binding protein [Marine Group I thaumarchaeote]